MLLSPTKHFAKSEKMMHNWTRPQSVDIFRNLQTLVPKSHCERGGWT